MSAAPRSPTRPCAFCGGPVTRTRPAVADQPPHLPHVVGDGALPEGNLLLTEDTPTDPVQRVTVARQQVTPPRPRVDPKYQEWLDMPLDQQPTDPPRIGWLLAAAAALLLFLFVAAFISQVIT